MNKKENQFLVEKKGKNTKSQYAFQIQFIKDDTVFVKYILEERTMSVGNCFSFWLGPLVLLLPKL
jgi:hypothetical protein